jgi:hypothetical protein
VLLELSDSAATFTKAFAETLAAVAFAGRATAIALQSGNDPMGRLCKQLLTACIKTANQSMLMLG